VHFAGGTAGQIVDAGGTPKFAFAAE